MLIDFNSNDLFVDLGDKLKYMRKRRACESLPALANYIKEVHNYVPRNCKYCKDLLNGMYESRKYYSLRLNNPDSSEFCIIDWDTKYAIELSGCVKSTYACFLEISLEHSLDFILYKLCDCDISKIRNIPNYMQISKAILSVDQKALEDLDISLSTFWGLDENLDNFIIGCCNKASDGNINSVDVFFSYVLSKCAYLATFITLYVKYIYELNCDNHIILRSKTCYSYIVNSTSFVEDLCLDEKLGYYIYPRQYTEGKYLELINKECSEMKGVC